MTWLIACLFVSVFVVIGISARKLNQDEKGATTRELNQAAATFGLLPQPQTGWSGAQVFAGTVRGFEVTWTLTPKSVGREVRIRLSGAKSTRAAGLQDVTQGDGFVELSYDDQHLDASELVSATRRLLERVVKA